MPFSEQRSALHCGVKACVPLKLHLQRGCTSALILGGRVDDCQPGDKHPGKAVCFWGFWAWAWLPGLGPLGTEHCGRVGLRR